jgi:hypothetical protein
MLTSHKHTILVAVIMCVGVGAVTVATVPRLRRIAKSTARKAGLLKRQPLAGPKTLLSADRVSARREMVWALHRALARRDYARAASLNARLGQEAWQRAKRVLHAWTNVRDPETGLVPRSIKAKAPRWNTRDVGADLFPFLLLAAEYLDSEHSRQWREALAREREICGPMPCSIAFRPARVVPQSRDAVVFGASEYAKDGLLSIAERLGRGPWFVRLEETALALIGAADVETRRGKIVASDTEVNGEMLQVLARLYWVTRKREYLDMAERIAETYLFEVLPKSGHLPPRRWDFSEGQPASRHFGFRDHGSEIIPGLVEVYFLQKMQQRPKAGRYREPLKKFLDLALVVGRTEDGLWYNSVDIDTRQPLSRGVVDTWGYILNAYHTFDLAEGTARYAGEIERAMRAAAARKSFAWEGRHFDGYADAIESMLYLLPWFDLAEGHQWVDDEIEVMFHMQAPSGFVRAEYLDGNFIRTALLYGFYKTQGVMAAPWREDLHLGAAYDRSDRMLYVHLSSGEPWEGVLTFDVPRHRATWRLPIEYPRLNGWPEWFVVAPSKTYAVLDVGTGTTAVHSGQVLAEGLPVRVVQRDAPLSLVISAQ